jgi:hypothetical protein
VIREPSSRQCSVSHIAERCQQAGSAHTKEQCQLYAARQTPKNYYGETERRTGDQLALVVVRHGIFSSSSELTPATVMIVMRQVKRKSVIH